MGVDSGINYLLYKGNEDIPGDIRDSEYWNGNSLVYSKVDSIGKWIIEEYIIGIRFAVIGEILIELVILIVKE